MTQEQKAPKTAEQLQKEIDSLNKFYSKTLLKMSEKAGTQELDLQMANSKIEILIEEVNDLNKVNSQLAAQLKEQQEQLQAQQKKENRQERRAKQKEERKPSDSK